ncbi:MAG TPA: potassium channel protein [Clostridium sp.]|nr:potassium channel protein [Clostridium sp.]
MKDLEFVKSEKTEFIYDVFAGIMSIIAVIIVMVGYSTGLSNRNAGIVRILDCMVYWIFVADYVIRFIFCKDKKKFLKYNIIDLIAIMPLMYISSLKYGNAFKLIRVITYIIRLLSNIKEILFTNGFIYALSIITIITLLGAIGVYLCEVNVNEGISKFEDALWWSIVTVTTVGYGDVIVITRMGRIIAIMLMFTGVGFISMFTSTMSTYCFAKLKEYDNRKVIVLDNSSCKDNIDLSKLTEEKRKSVIDYYEFLLSSEEENDKKNS